MNDCTRRQFVVGGATLAAIPLAGCGLPSLATDGDGAPTNVVSDGRIVDVSSADVLPTGSAIGEEWGATSVKTTGTRARRHYRPPEGDFDGKHRIWAWVAVYDDLEYPQRRLSMYRDAPEDVTVSEATYGDDASRIEQDEAVKIVSYENNVFVEVSGPTTIADALAPVAAAIFQSLSEAS